MGYNHAREVKKFYKEWRVLLRYYRDHGMTYQEILVLYKFDKAKLRADRLYALHCVGYRCDERDSDYAVMPDFDTYGINNWIDVLPDELRQRLVGFPEVYLKAFYLCRVCGYLQDEAAVILNKPQSNISYWIVKINKVLKEYRKSW